jgi:hypothetical protein
MSKEGPMLSQRNTHYWLWFLLFGVVSALVTLSKGEGITTETLWLLIADFLGLLGVLHNFGLNLVPTGNVPANAIDESAILGLSLSLPYALIHSVLGLTSLSHGLRPKVARSQVTVAAPAAAA